jgi:hypothetical protein
MPLYLLYVDLHFSSSIDIHFCSSVDLHFRSSIDLYFTSSVDLHFSSSIDLHFSSSADISKIQDKLSDIRSGNLEKLSDRKKICLTKKNLKCHNIFLVTIKNSFIFCYSANEIMLCLVSITNVKPFGFVNLTQPFIVS